MFIPYTGPGGPTSEQRDGNARALALAVSGEVRTVTDDEFGAAGELYVVKGDRAVIYDRWGFCAVSPETGNEDLDIPLSDTPLDQAQWEAAVAYLNHHEAHNG